MVFWKFCYKPTPTGVLCRLADKFPPDKCPPDKYQALALVRGELVALALVRGELVRPGTCPGGTCPPGTCPGGTCPGGTCPPWHYEGELVRSGTMRGNLSALAL